jgi:GT2 family glycosyltransferase
MRRCVVAVPVRDEAEHLPKCLNALAAQRDQDGRPLVFGRFSVAIFANNCDDKSAELVRSLGRGLPFPVRVVEASLLPDFAHAGGARREAMNQADDWLSERTESDGVILTTDADSQVPSDWIANNLAAIDAGADAVLGRVVLDEEGDHLPQALHHRGLLESVYEALLTELSALLDPVDYNPWPHHATISGATLAVTREAYRRVGGLPCVPLGEDKALVAQLARIDARIRFCPDIEVMTSGRIKGRAPGGVADTLRLRSGDPDAFCDEALEPLRVALRRAKWRGFLRRLYHSAGSKPDSDCIAGLGIASRDARHVFCAETFGELWSAVEATSPVLTRRLLNPAQLPKQISIAQRVLARIRKRALSLDQDVDAESVVAIAPLDSHLSLHARDEDIRSLVAG